MEDNLTNGANEQTLQNNNGTQPQVIFVQPQQSQPSQPAQNQTGQAMFTQQQVNDIVSGRVSGLNAKIAELTKANETLKADAESYKSKYDELEQRSVLTASGIPESLADYVKFEVSKMSANGKSFSENVAEYLKANQPFIDSIKQGVQGNNGQQNGASAGVQPSLQSPLLQQLAGQTNTNGRGNQSVGGNNGLQGIDVDAVLAKEGLKRRK